MSDFKQDVNKNLIMPLGSDLYEAVMRGKLSTVTYNFSDNQYEYNFGDKSVKLYSTNDILNYYFEDNLEQVLKEEKIYTITLECDVDIITYEGVIIGLGASNKRAEQAFNKLISADEVVDFLENNQIASGVIGSGTTVVTGINEPVGNFAANLVAYFNSARHLGNTNTGTGVDSNEYANAIAALEGIDTFALSYPGSIILSEYSGIFKNESDKNLLKKFFITQNELGSMGYSYGEVFDYLSTTPFSLLKFLETFGAKPPKSYQDWIKQFDTDNDRSDIKFSNEAILIEFDYEEFLDINFADSPFLYDDATPEAGIYSSDEIIGIWENTSAIDNFSKRINKIIKTVASVVNNARTTRYDPLIFDLDNDGFNVETKENGANFDLDKNGLAEKINWTKKDGILCLDLNGNGIIDNGGEVFGDQTLIIDDDGTTAKNGFEALAQYDINGDGVIDADDEIFSQLRIWVDADGNGISGDGELKTLSELGIVSINLKYTKYFVNIYHSMSYTVINKAA